MRVDAVVLQSIAEAIGAQSDAQLATFLGITTEQLEMLRYGRGSIDNAIVLLDRIQALRKTADALEKVVDHHVDKYPAPQVA